MGRRRESATVRNQTSGGIGQWLRRDPSSSYLSCGRHRRSEVRTSARGRLPRITEAVSTSMSAGLISVRDLQSGQVSIKLYTPLPLHGVVTVRCDADRGLCFGFEGTCISKWSPRTKESDARRVSPLRSRQCLVLCIHLRLSKLHVPGWKSDALGVSRYLPNNRSCPCTCCSRMTKKS